MFKLGDKIICKGLDADLVEELGFDIRVGHEYYITKVYKVNGIEYFNMVDNDWKRIGFFDNVYMNKCFDTERDLRKKKLERLGGIC